MTEVEAYKKVYGDLVYYVPHYRKRISDPNKKVDAGYLNSLFERCINRKWSDENIDPVSKVWMDSQLEEMERMEKENTQ